MEGQIIMEKPIWYYWCEKYKLWCDNAKLLCNKECNNCNECKDIS